MKTRVLALSFHIIIVLIVIILLYTYRSRKEYCVSKIATFYVIQRLHVTVYRSLDLICLRKLKKKKKGGKVNEKIDWFKKNEIVTMDLFASYWEIRNYSYSFLFEKERVRVLFPFAKIREI